MQASLKRAKAKRCPVYFRVERLVRPETGESIGALVPLTKWDAKAMRERKYHIGKELRADLKGPRNIKFHNLAHALGDLVKDHADGFEGMDAHDAIKKMQRESGVCCEQSEFDLGPPFGKVVIATPESIAFDEMLEERFSHLMQGLCAHIRKTYLGVPNEAIEEILLTVESGA